MYWPDYIDGLVQERRQSFARALELHLPCTNLSIYRYHQCLEFGLLSNWNQPNVYPKHPFVWKSPMSVDIPFIPHNMVSLPVGKIIVGDMITMNWLSQNPLPSTHQLQRHMKWHLIRFGSGKRVVLRYGQTVHAGWKRLLSSGSTSAGEWTIMTGWVSLKQTGPLHTTELASRPAILILGMYRR